MDSPLIAFQRVLDPEDNQTGGGAASAIAGAMAASLVGMVARLSIGRKGMEPADFYQEIDLEARQLCAALLSGAQEDSQAFDDVMAAYRKPRESPEQQEARSHAIQAALTHATEVPLINAEYCAQTLALCTKLAGRSNTNAASDLSCARYLGHAALSGCLSNIAVNLASIKDPDTHRRLTYRFDDLTSQSERLKAA